jgi:catechol 2,3-dioxygenase-like lactoylglutathione lyase family enzyme
VSTPGHLHHIELYVSDLARSLAFWEPLLSMLGYAPFQRWDRGMSFRLDEAYIVFAQADEAHLEPAYHRKRVGLNHLAFHAGSRAQVEEITGWVREGGYRVLYEDRHPHAGGQDCYALYCEDPDRIKVEIVAPQ